MAMESDGHSAGGTEHTSGEYLGEFQGLVIRGTLEGTGRPVLEIHGEDGMAAVEATEKSVEGFTEASAEIQMALDHSVDTDTDQ
jgi:hypothetical protein